MGYRVIEGKLHFIGNLEAAGSYASGKALNARDKESISYKNSFHDILSEKINPKNNKDCFVISGHAAGRLKNRNISFNEADMKNINEGINKAADKGSRECLILYKDVAMVASIKNRTIITAVGKDKSKGNVFTNIDSVVLL